MARRHALVFVLGLALTAFAGDDRTTEEGEAAIKDPNDECAYYSLPIVEDNLSKFPTQGQPATIVDGDDAANALFDQIAATLPDIAPKGTLEGDFSSVQYGDDDPDCWWTWSLCTTPKHENVPADVARVPEPKTLGYGFDDGPNCSHNAFYDYLQEKNQKATMFYIGTNVLALPLEAQRGVKDGHEICIHTWSHRYMTAFDNRGAFAELYYSVQAVKLVTGVTPTCWRPPFGDVDDRIRAIAAGLNLETILWEYDSDDWKIGAGELTPEQVDKNYQDFIDEATVKHSFDQVGAIILAHEIDAGTMDMAMKWYDKLDEAFDYIVPVGVAMNRTKIYPEDTVKFPTFDEYVKELNGGNGGDNGGSSSASSAGGAEPTASGSAGSHNSGSGGAAGSPTPGSSDHSTTGGGDGALSLSPSSSILVLFAFLGALAL